MTEHETGNMQATVSPEDVAARLTEALQLAGGRDVVVAKGLVSKRTLQRAVSGLPVSKSSLFGIAAALGVPARWLLYGGSSINPEWIKRTPIGAIADDSLEVSEGPVMPLPELSAAGSAAPPPKLFSFVDMELLAGAIETARTVFTTQGSEPSGVAFAQIVCILYDEAVERLRGRVAR